MEHSSPFVIETRSLTKEFMGFVAVNNVNLKVKRHTIHAMVENAYRITLAGAFVPLAAGLFWKKASNLGAGLSISFGLITWIILEITDVQDPVPPQLFGVMAALLGMVFGSYMSPNSPHGHGGHPKHI